MPFTIVGAFLHRRVIGLDVGDAARQIRARKLP